MNETGTSKNSQRGVLMFTAFAVVVFGGFAARSAAETDRENGREYGDRMGNGRQMGPAAYINLRSPRRRKGVFSPRLPDVFCPMRAVAWMVRTVSLQKVTARPPVYALLRKSKGTNRFM